MRSTLFLGMVVVVVFVATVAFLAWQSTLQYREDQRRVTHTHQVLEELNAVLARIRDAESSTRGYIATGDEAFLKPYEGLRASILNSDDGLRALVGDNPSQVARVDRLDPLLTARINRFDDLIQLRKTSGAAAAAAGLTPGRILSEKAHEVMREMEQEERSLLKIRGAETERSFGRTLALLSVLGIAVVAILAGLFFSAQQASLARLRADDILRRSRGRAPGSL